MDRRLLSIDSRTVEKILRFYGFKLSRQKGDHQQFLGFVKGRKSRVTVLAKQKHFAPKTIKSMIQQSNLSEQQWIDYISK